MQCSLGGDTVTLSKRSSLRCGRTVEGQGELAIVITKPFFLAVCVTLAHESPRPRTSALSKTPPPPPLSHSIAFIHSHQAYAATTFQRFPTSTHHPRHPSNTTTAAN